MPEPSTTAGRRSLPPWLKVKLGKAGRSQATRELLGRHGVHTVCQSARCPNIGECFGSGTATFLLLGNTCTRACGFCAVGHGRPQSLDAGEAERIAAAAADLGLDFVVLTSVTRDDLPDGGAAAFAATVRALRQRLPGAQVEVLTPDFRGDRGGLSVVLEAGPDVFNHNVETVRRLQPVVRPQAGYGRSLAVLAAAGELAPGLPVKSGLMVGLGETDDEVREAMADLRSSGVSRLTIGQYLRPSARQLPVDRYVPPAQFEEYRRWGLELGFAYIASGPFVRSSYHAALAARVAGEGAPAP